LAGGSAAFDSKESAQELLEQGLRLAGVLEPSCSLILVSSTPGAAKSPELESWTKSNRARGRNVASVDLTGREGLKFGAPPTIELCNQAEQSWPLLECTRQTEGALDALGKLMVSFSPSMYCPVNWRRYTTVRRAVKPSAPRGLAPRQGRRGSRGGAPPARRPRKGRSPDPHAIPKITEEDEVAEAEAAVPAAAPSGPRVEAWPSWATAQAASAAGAGDASWTWWVEPAAPWAGSNNNMMDAAAMNSMATPFVPGEAWWPQEPQETFHCEPLDEAAGATGDSAAWEVLLDEYPEEGQAALEEAQLEASVTEGPLPRTLAFLPPPPGLSLPVVLEEAPGLTELDCLAPTEQELMLEPQLAAEVERPAIEPAKKEKCEDPSEQGGALPKAAEPSEGVPVDDAKEKALPPVPLDIDEWPSLGAIKGPKGGRGGAKAARGRRSASPRVEAATKAAEPVSAEAEAQPEQPPGESEVGMVYSRLSLLALGVQMRALRAPCATASAASAKPASGAWGPAAARASSSQCCDDDVGQGLLPKTGPRPPPEDELFEELPDLAEPRARANSSRPQKAPRQRSRAASASVRSERELRGPATLRAESAA